MRTLQQILESIEKKKREITEGDKRYFGNDLKQARGRGKWGGFPIRGYNAPFDPFQITEHLSDEEFGRWFNHKQENLWKEIKEAGIEEIRCLDCEEIIKKPEDMIRWGGIVYRGNCFINSVESGKLGLSQHTQPYYKRIKRTVFGR